MTGHFDFDNPARPEDCVGRTVTLDDIDDQLRTQGSNVRLILGGRHCGKSTVMDAIADRLTKRLHDMLHADHAAAASTMLIPVRISLKLPPFQQADDVLGYLTYYIMLATHGTHKPNLEYPVVQLGLPELGNESIAPADLERLQQTIRTIIHAASARYQLDARIVLLVDDVQHVLGKDYTPWLFARLHSLAKSSDVRKVVRLVLAGPRRMLSQEVVGSSPFTGEPQTFCDALDREAALELIGRAEGLPENVIQMVACVSGGHPYILQYLLSNLCEIDPGEATVDLVKQIAAVLGSHSQRNVFESWWSDLGGIGRRVYEAICAVSPRDVERPAVRISALNSRVGATPLEVRAGLEELRAHGLVCAMETRAYVLGSELFRSWLERRGWQPAPAPRLAEKTAAPNAAVVDHTDGELRMSNEAIRATRSITVQGGNPAVNRSPDRNLLVQLREFLTEYFSQEELRTVCFDLGIDYHDLGGEGKAGKARELVAYYERHGRIFELVAVGRRLRPGVSLGNSADQRISPERVPRSNDVVEQVLGEAPVDVGIIVALREEFRELHLELPAPIVIKDENTGASDYLFQWPVENAQPYCCAATFVGIMGPTEAALATERFLNRRQPKTIVMLGIAAGTSDDVKLGDVIIATHVGRYLDRAKVVSNPEKTFDIRPGGDAFPCSGDLVRASLDFEFAHWERYASWRDVARTQLQDLVEEKRRSILLEQDWLNERPSFLEGPVASGPVVAASKEFVEWVKSTNRNYRALEMEGGAMLAAVYSHAEPSRSLMLRGISDFGDERKEALDQVGKGGLRRYATRNAIGLLWGLLEARVLPSANPQ